MKPTLRITSIAAFVALLVVVLVPLVGSTGCDSIGKEGDRCNPLVLRDECNAGLHCKPASCSEAYCCPTNGSSNDPHCNAEGCPEPDAGDDGGSEASDDASSEASDAPVDAPSDASDAADDATSDAPTDGPDAG